MTDTLNSLHCESNTRHFNDFISAIVFSLEFLRLHCIFFDQQILFYTLCIYEENFSEAHFFIYGKYNILNYTYFLGQSRML